MIGRDQVILSLFEFSMTAIYLQSSKNTLYKKKNVNREQIMVIPAAVKLFRLNEFCVIKSSKNLSYGTANNGRYDSADNGKGNGGNVQNEFDPFHTGV